MKEMLRKEPHILPSWGLSENRTPAAAAAILRPCGSQPGAGSPQAQECRAATWKAVGALMILAPLYSKLVIRK